MKTAWIAQILGYAGLIPFVFLALDPLLTGFISAPLARLSLLSYGAIILSFLGGIIWGRSLDNPQAGGAMIVSVVLSLAGWGAILWLGPEAFWVLAVGFGAALFYDMGGNLPPWFRRLRIHLSIGAALAMIVGALT